MKKYYLLSLLLAVSSTPIIAQHQEEKVFTILDSLSQYSSFQATFTYTNQTPPNGPGEAIQGKISVQGSKYRLSLGTQEIVSNGETVWTYLPDAKEVQITLYDPEQEAVMPWHVFTNYRQDYKLLSTHHEQVGKCTCDIIALLSKDPEHPSPKVILTIERATKHIKRLEALDSNHTLHAFSIINFEVDLAFDEPFFNFAFEEHEDLEVIDMR